MRIDAAPDPDWYFDHVLAVSGPDRVRIGPARGRQAAWLSAVRDLGATNAHGSRGHALDLAQRQGLVLRRDQVPGCALTLGEVRGLVRRGEWSAPRYGVVSPLPDAPARPDGRKRVDAVRPHGHALQIRAAAAALVRPGVVVSHESAAAMHGLPLIDGFDRPTLSTAAEARAAGRRDVLIRCVGLRPEEITAWFGVPVTTVPRTVIDVARCSGLAAGLVVADAALHDSLTTVDELAAARINGRYRTGIRTVDRMLELAEDRTESPLESLARLCLVEGGLPAPEPQRWIATDRGEFRVDLLYEAQRVIIEADGELKYRGPDDEPWVAERRRHEALVRAGFIVIRVSWSEIWNEPGAVVDRVRRALAARVTGWPA